MSKRNRKERRLTAANAAQRTVERAWSSVPADKLQYYMRLRHNPLPTVAPDSLRRMQEAWDCGWLQDFALTSRQMVRKDDMLRAVASKRHQSPMVRGWEIVMTEDTPEAEAHKAALEYCYNNLVATVATEPDCEGSTALLLEQMNEAVSFKWACHEMELLTSADGITARLHYVHNDWFERTTGRLRFRSDYASPYGAELVRGNWIIHSADGLQDAAAIAWLYKHMSLQDWLIYCTRHGMPGFLGKSGAVPNSPEWKVMETAVASLSAEWAGVISKDDDVTALQLGSAGELPYPPMVAHMDRAFATLYRGGDLSTISGQQPGDNPGASVQGGETDRLDAADATRICDTLNRSLDLRVIRWAFGEGVTPLAYFSVKGLTRDMTDQNIKVDQALHTMGFPLTLQSLSERYGRPLPSGAEALLPPPQPQAVPGQPPFSAANEGPSAQARLARIMGVQRRWLDPAAEEIRRLETVLRDKTVPDEEAYRQAQAIISRLPELGESVNDKELADLLFATMSAAAAESIRGAGK